MKFSDYQPSPEVLERLKQVDLVMVIGPTAAGKTTLMKAAQANGLATLVLTTTSRAPRPGEQNDADFHFRSEAEMLKRIARGEYVQVAPNVFGPLYATLPEDYTTKSVACMPVIVDALPVFRALPFKRLREVFILPPSWQKWQTRIAKQGFKGADLQKRMAEAKTSLHYAATKPGLLFVLNDDRQQAVADFQALLTGQAPAINSLEGQKHAQELLFMLEN